MISILIVDDHPMVREGLLGIFGRDPDFRVVGEAGGGEEALQKLVTCDPDVISVGLRLPGMTGLDLCSRLARSRPTVRILALASYSGERVIADAIGAGAHGFVRKGSSPQLLREAVRALARGGTFVDPGVVRDPAELTPEEPSSRS